MWHWDVSSMISIFESHKKKSEDHKQLICAYDQMDTETDTFNLLRVRAV